MDVEKDVLGSLTGEVAWSSRLRAQGDDGAEHAVTDCATHLREMANACEVYKIDHSVYPDSLLDLHPKYLTELPTCPVSGSYKYQRSADGDSFSCSAPGRRTKRRAAAVTGRCLTVSRGWIGDGRRVRCARSSPSRR